MGLDAEEGFSEGYVGGDVDDGVGGEVVELDAVEVKEASEEWMDGESQTSDEVRDEDDALAGLRLRHPDGGEVR